jgi:hypothetical protein
MSTTEIIDRHVEVDVIQPAAPAVSWGAIAGGAFVIAATGFILLALGAGFGFASPSPWQDQGPSAAKFAIVAAIWLIVVQWVSSGLGGYVAGRLRTRWASLHVDESYFRDTAHGIVAWAVAAVITIALLSAGASSILGGTARGVTRIAAGAAQGASQGATQNANSAAPSGYLVDTLFRSDRPNPNANPQDVRGEATRILANDLVSGEVPVADKTYLAQLVATQTGLSQDDAQKRVDDVIAKAKQAEQKAREAADAARKAARNLAFFTAFSLLIGAFIAGVAAKMGGHHRDEII